MIRLGISTALATLGLLACAAPSTDDPRTAWLRGTLLADNRSVILRFPDDAQGKFAKMAATPYTFMRGTAAQAARDVIEPGPYQRTSRYSSAAANRRAILGDAHLENVGSYRAGGRRLLVDFNDFDGATFGPYYLDVWRLCTSIGVAFHDAPEETRRLWMTAVAEAYAEAITALARGDAPQIIDAENSVSVVFDDLLDRARDDGDTAEKLNTYTRIVDDRRVMRFGEIEPPGRGFVGDVVWQVGPAEKQAITVALATWRSSLIDPSVVPPGIVQVKGVSRRLGAGVSSYPLPRYYVLLEGPTAETDDDWLLELKEAGDPLPLPGLIQYPWPRHATNAARVIDLQRRLQAYVDDDPLLGEAQLSPQTFRVRRREGYQKNISVRRMRQRRAEGRWTDADLTATFAAMGALLARAHGGARGADGETGAASISAAIETDITGFVNESVAFAITYAPAVLADHARFKAMRAQDPLLGYRPDTVHF